MGTDAYEGIQKKLREIEEEEYQNEKLRKQLQKAEEDGWYQDERYMEQNRRQSLRLVQDAKIQRLLKEQQDDLRKMQGERTRFMEAARERLVKRGRELEGLREE